MLNEKHNLAFLFFFLQDISINRCGWRENEHKERERESMKTGEKADREEESSAEWKRYRQINSYLRSYWKITVAYIKFESSGWITCDLLYVLGEYCAVFRCSVCSEALGWLWQDMRQVLVRDGDADLDRVKAAMKMKKMRMRRRRQKGTLSRKASRKISNSAYYFSTLHEISPLTRCSVWYSSLKSFGFHKI